MTHALSPREMPEDREYVRYLAEIEMRRGHVADLEADLAEYREELGRFSAEYHTRVGSLFLELDRLELAIVEYEFRLGQLRAETDVDPEELERQVRHGFSQQREQIHDDEEETRAYEQMYRKERDRSRLDEQSGSTLKSLFRDLAKRFHPDLASTDDERRHRELIMKQVNTAFHERDIDALRTLSMEKDAIDPGFESTSIGDKLVWAIREVSRLDNLIESLVAERASLESSELGLLWERHRSGEDVLQRLENGLRGRIDEEQHCLRSLIEQYRVLIESRHA